MAELIVPFSADVLARKIDAVEGTMTSFLELRDQVAKLTFEAFDEFVQLKLEWDSFDRLAAQRGTDPCRELLAFVSSEKIALDRLCCYGDLAGPYSSLTF